MLEDMQKLISGKAPYKMMVGPLNTGIKEKDDPDNYLEVATSLAEEIKGTLYFLFIPHPHSWKPGKLLHWKLYKWSDSAKWKGGKMSGKWTVKK